MIWYIKGRLDNEESQLLLIIKNYEDSLFHNIENDMGYQLLEDKMNYCSGQ